ncbi:hypothetical protein DL765_006799 [Monosporascus sp. GIB2]|nr:hypothetical protein DL765_006799 [Monosporascus sp. GIB2]
MHYSPGAPVLKSYNLVNWDYVGHSVPELSFGAKYNLEGGSSAYVAGIWASSLRYRKSDGQYYWLGCIDFAQTHIFRAPEATGPWSKIATLPRCYYDAGLLFDDDDDSVYVAYGSTNIEVAQLSRDCTSQIRSQVVHRADIYIEGSRMYKINGSYYIFVTRAPDAEFVLKAGSPFGPYQIRNLVDRIGSPVPDTGAPHQGGIVDTPDGDWYYASFIDAYPLGRIPVLAPISWSGDGWPTLQKVNNAWGKEYEVPIGTDWFPSPPRVTYNFSSPTLPPQWEWNHNPDSSKWSILRDGGLRLETATATNDLYSARNTLTHRIRGPRSQGTFHINIARMTDGDRAGAVMLRDRSAYIGVWKEGAEARIVMVDGMTMDSNWKTNSTGKVAARGPVLSGGDVWLRIVADVTPAFNSGRARSATFWYSTEGLEGSYRQLGPAFSLHNSWRFFMAYRYGVFNHATKVLGGSVSVRSFTMDQL